MIPTVLIFPDTLKLASFLMSFPITHVEVNEESLTAVLPDELIEIATKQYDACLLNFLPIILPLA